MFDLTKKTDYGIELMVALAKNYGKVSLKYSFVALFFGVFKNSRFDQFSIKKFVYSVMKRKPSCKISCM